MAEHASSVRCEAALGELRRQIDDVDEALLGLVAERCGLVRRVQRLKRANGLPERSPRREQEIFERAAELAGRLGMPGDDAVSLLKNAVRCCLLAAAVPVRVASADSDDT